ncbi:coiled-coil domain-containing protein 177 isoform X2 [Oncorhynchus keta]|nr:coiled-coil domain-containing protein 177 isoform X2 [Oncorhynchus keta]
MVDPSEPEEQTKGKQMDALPVASPPTRLPDQASPPTRLPDQASPPTRLPDQASPPTRLPDQASPPTRLPDQASPPTRLPDQASPPTRLPDQASPPTRLPDQASPPTRLPDQASPPTRLPDQASPPTRLPDQASPPTRLPDQASPPTRLPDQASPPTRLPDQASPPTRLPDQASPPTRLPDQASAPTRLPDQASPPTRLPDQASPPTRLPDQASPPTRLPDQASPPTRLPDQASPPTRLPDQADGKATEEGEDGGGNDAETTPIHSAGLGERMVAPPPVAQEASPPSPNTQPQLQGPPERQLQLPHLAPPDFQPPTPHTQLQSPQVSLEAATPLSNSSQALNPLPQDLQPPSGDPEPREPCPKLHLDLYNFDTPVAEGSRYVLTSPRSLEACARCGVKPVEILSRPLSDFAREAPGRSMRVATGMFEVYEKDRHAKLRACREERDRIIREDKRRILQAASSTEEQHRAPVTSSLTPLSKPGPVASSPTKSKPSPSSIGRASRAASTTPGPSINKTSTNLLAKSSSLQSSKSSSFSSASSSSRGLDCGFGSAKHPKSSELTKAPRPVSGPPPVVRKIPSSSTTTTTPKASNTFPRSASKPSSFPRTTTSMTSTIFKSSVQSPVTPTTAALNGITGGLGGPFPHHNGHPVSTPKGRGKSHSLESLQRRMDTISTSTTTSTTTCTSSGEESGASSSYSWDGPRDPWAKSSSPRARTLATFNSLMGRSLSLGDLSHSLQTTQKVERIVKEVRRRGLKAVPERDRKIAALMLARYQEEDIMSQTRYVAHLQWDSEKRLGDLQREQEDREKQRAVLQCQRAWQSQVSHRQRRLSQQERESSAAKLRQVAESEERWRELAELQESSRQQRLQQAAREEKQKKEQQEQNLKALEEDRAAVLEQEQLLLKEKLTIAELKKQEKEHQAHEERRGLNRAERRRHAALIKEIARREEEEREDARKAAEEKLSRSLENYEQIVERRDKDLKEKAKREEQQIQKARRSAENREKQQQQQVEARAKEAERRAQQAALVAEERAKEKSQRAVQSRQEKERLQRLNRQRVEGEELARRMELLQSIERKLEKSEQIFREKRAVLESARSTARASFHVRDRVREETNMRTFDKMDLEAQFQFKASLDDK